MGCDIHPVIECRMDKTEPRWDWFATVELSRDYALFTILAGVRDHYTFVDPEFKRPEPKGLPDGLSWRGEENTGDHSFSWMTSAELVKSAAAYQKHVRYPGQTDHEAPAELKAIIAAMASLEESGYETRLVFGFDS